MSTDFLKYPFQLLEDNSSLNAELFEKYLVFKTYCRYSKKSGYVSKGELPTIALRAGVNPKTLYRLQSGLKEHGLIKKEGNGYYLPNIIKLNKTFEFVFNQFKDDKDLGTIITKNNLNIKNHEHKLDGFQYVPYLKVKANDIKDLPEIKMNFLIDQIAKHRNYHLEANKNPVSSSKEDVEHKGFTVSLEKIRLRGNYKNDNQVKKIIENAEKLNLVKVMKHGYDVKKRKFNCNSYFTNNYDFYDGIDGLEPIVISSEKKKKKTTKKCRLPLALGQCVITKDIELENKFNLFVERAKSELIEKGFLKQSYSNKKVSRSSYSRLLKELLTKKGWSDIVLDFIGKKNIHIYSKIVKVNKWNQNTYSKFKIDDMDKYGNLYVTDYRFRLHTNALPLTVKPQYFDVVLNNLSNWI